MGPYGSPMRAEYTTGSPQQPRSAAVREEIAHLADAMVLLEKTCEELAERLDAAVCPDRPALAEGQRNDPGPPRSWMANELAELNERLRMTTRRLSSLAQRVEL